LKQLSTWATRKYAYSELISAYGYRTWLPNAERGREIRVMMQMNEIRCRHLHHPRQWSEDDGSRELS
jgi:hypothetical protein